MKMGTLIGTCLLTVVSGSQAVHVALMLLFVGGLLKTWTYGAVLVFHAVSTFSAFGKYLQPFDNLLFFAAWSMLGACAALFLLRHYDTLSLSPCRHQPRLP